MQLPRIHSPMPLREGATLTLSEIGAAHVTRALRLGAGDAITLFDGSGVDYSARILTAAKSGVTVVVGAERPARTSESPLDITLLQGISRGPRMDLVMQKATELGVTAIQPVFAERSVVRLDAGRSAARREHWQRIVVGACEQSGRARVPEVRPPLDLEAAFVALAPGTIRLCLDPAAPATLSSLGPRAGSVVLAIGPEGGFAPAEVSGLKDAGFTGLRLGPRVLRTETAPLVALALLQYEWGDLDDQ